MGQITILLVEDDAGHAQLIQKNLRRANLTNDIITVSDGHQAVDFVLREGPFSERDQHLNLLILLDLNLPVLDGFQDASSKMS